ncbi:MAG TPA: DUF2169 domain-containing protein [Archangium sp.]|nr:DUF2169 domain-containing protein [Archangium sp.]
MWWLNNRTAYAAERNWTRDRDGAHWWVVAVKATFDVSPAGKLELAHEQLPPVLVPEYYGEPGASSLRYDSDLLAAKPGTDVIVNAHAHAPGGKPAMTVPVSLRVGGLDKRVLVHGERFYRRGVFGLAMSSPLPFTSRQIRYESAFGGQDFSDPDSRKHCMDVRNPIGRGVAANSARLVDQPAHFLEYLQGDAAAMGPAGFGAIDRSWVPRRNLAGTYDERWARTKRPLLPDDYDPAFALSAPSDQRLRRFLVGGELMELVHMTPEGVLRFRLPTVVLAFRSRFGARWREHPGQMVTVIVEPEEHRLLIVWQTALRVSAQDVDFLDETEIVERQGAL